MLAFSDIKFTCFILFFVVKLERVNERRCRNISLIKKSIIHIRSSLRLIILVSIAVLIILAILAIFYKPAYIVTYNGQFIGYSESKSKLQEKINLYIENGNLDNPNIAYVEIEFMPSYKLTFLKRNVQTNDEDIYNAVVSTGVTYYNYFAIQLNNEDKYFVSTYSEAEDVVKKLKEKDTNNIDKIKIVEKYKTELAQFSAVDDCVNGLYEKKPVVVKKKPVSTGKTTYAANLGISLVEPAQGVITSRFGWRPRDNHKGIDIANSIGSPIKAVASGTVTYAQFNTGGYGYLVKISHGNGIETFYAHNSKLYVSVGQTVQQGEVIAAMGSTGISTGSHCHFEIRVKGVAQNPQNYIYKGR